MDYKSLYPLIYSVLAVGLLLGVGILALDYFGDAVKTPATINETITITSLVGQTANDEVTSATFFGNATVSCSPVISSCMNISSSGRITTNSSFANGAYNLRYTYDADSAGTTALSNSITAVSAISSTWLPLIITVSVLAILLYFIIGSFGKAGRD